MKVKGDYNRLIECSNGGTFTGINIFKNSKGQVEGLNFICSRRNISISGLGSVDQGFYFGNAPKSPKDIQQGICDQGSVITGIEAIHQRQKVIIGQQLEILPLQGFKVQCCSLPQNSCKNKQPSWQASQCKTKVFGIPGVETLQQLQTKKILQIADSSNTCTKTQILQSLVVSYVDQSGVWNVEAGSCKDIKLRVGKDTDNCNNYKDVQCQGIASDYCYSVLPQSPQELQDFPFGYYACEIAGQSLKTLPGEVLESDFQNQDYSSQCSKTQELNGGWIQIRSQNLKTCLQMSAQGWQGFAPCSQTDKTQWFRFNDPKTPSNSSQVTYSNFKNLESALFSGRCIEPPIGGSFLMSPSKTSPYQNTQIQIDAKSKQVHYKNGSYLDINTVYSEEGTYSGKVWEFLQIEGDKQGGAFLRNPESGLCMSKQKKDSKNPYQYIYAVDCNLNDTNQRWSFAPAKSKLGMNLVDDQLSCIAFPDPTNKTYAKDSGLVLISQQSCQNELQSLAAFELLSVATDAGSCLTSSAFFRYDNKTAQIQMNIAKLVENQCVNAKQDNDGTQYLSAQSCPTNGDKAFKFDIIPIQFNDSWQQESIVFNQLIDTLGVNSLDKQKANQVQVEPIDFKKLVATNYSASLQLLRAKPQYCGWSFVRCDLYGRIVSLQLNVLAQFNLKIHKTLPSVSQYSPHFLGLPNLQALSLKGLRLIGQFPSQVSISSPLRSLDLTNTTLSGPLPSSWADNFKSLKFLTLKGSQVTGEIGNNYFDPKLFNSDASILVQTAPAPPPNYLCTHKDFETMPQRFPLGAYKNQEIKLCPHIYDASKQFMIQYKITAPQCVKCSDIRLQLGQQYAQTLQNYSLWDIATFTTNCTYDNQNSQCAKSSDQTSQEGLRKRALLQNSDTSTSISLFLNGYFTVGPAQIDDLASSLRETFVTYSGDNQFKSELQILYGTQVLASFKPSPGQRMQLASGYVALIAVVGCLILLGLGILFYFLYRRKDRQQYYQAKLKKRNLAKLNKMGSLQNQLGVSLLQSRSSSREIQYQNEGDGDLLRSSLSQALQYYSNLGQQSKVKPSEASQVQQASKQAKLVSQKVSPLQSLKARSAKLLSTKSSNLISMSSMSSTSSASTLVIRMSSGQNFQDQMDRALNRDRTISIDPRQYETQLDKIEEDINTQDLPNQNVLAQAAKAAQVKYTPQIKNLSRIKRMIPRMQNWQYNFGSSNKYNCKVKGSQLLMNATNLMQLYYSQVNKPRLPDQQVLQSTPEDPNKPMIQRKPSPVRKYDYSISQILDTTSTTNDGPSHLNPSSMYITKQVGPEFLDFQIRLVIKMLNDQYEIVEPIESYQHLGSSSYIIFVKKNLVMGSKANSDEIQPAPVQGQQNPQQPPSKSFQIYAIKIYFEQDAFSREVQIYKNGSLRSVVPTVQQIHHGNTQALARYMDMRQLDDGQQALEMIQDSNNTQLCLPFMVLEAGETLRSWQKRHKDRAMNQARYIVCQVGNLVQTLHQNQIVHGNLSTSHIVWDDTVKAWKLIDFSCSQVQNAPGKYLGSPVKFQFSPPEVVLASDKSEVKVDPKVDVWALGMIAYNLYTTESFFHSKVKNEIIAQYLQDFRRFARRLEVGKLSKQLEQVGQVIMQMLGKSPRYRPTVDQAMKQLEQCSEAMWNQKQVKLMLGAMAHWPEKGQESTGMVSTKYLDIQISIKQDPADDVSDKVALLQYSQEKGDDVASFGIVPGTPFYLNFRLAARNIDDAPIDIPLSSTRVVIMDIKKPQKGQILILIPNMLATSNDMWEFQALWDPTKHNLEALNEGTTENVNLEGIINLVVIQQIQQEMVERVIRLSKKIRFQTMTYAQITQIKKQQQVSSKQILQNNTFSAKFSVDE